MMIIFKQQKKEQDLNMNIVYDGMTYKLRAKIKVINLMTGMRKLYADILAKTQTECG